MLTHFLGVQDFQVLSLLGNKCYLLFKKLSFPRRSFAVSYLRESKIPRCHSTSIVGKSIRGTLVVMVIALE